MDVFEGKSRPRLLLAIAGWFFVILTGGVVLNGALGSGMPGDVVVFGLFFIVLLMIAAAETHGLYLVRKGEGSRRLIITIQGVEVINAHRMTGISSYEWDEIDRIEVEPAKQGGAHLRIYTHASRKAAIRVVSALASVTPEQVRYELDRLREAARADKPRES